MKHAPKLLRLSCLAAAALSAASLPSAFAQTAPQPPAGDDKDEAVVLSPFTVTATSDSDSYMVKDTLAGARVRTDIRDVPSSLSVVSKRFLQDTGARKNEDLLVYTTNTDVGGIFGNFSGAGGSSTYNEIGNLLRPNENTRVRGLDAADNTRDYFLTSIPWDGYNVDRVDLQRGPNSILFGVGSPAGIINTSVNGAMYRNAYTLENRVGSFGSIRDSIDLNHVLIDNVLSLRVASVDDDTKYRQKPAFNHDRRIFGAVRFDPQLFDAKTAHTSIRANYEYGDVQANRPRSLPPIDAITPWFKTGTSYGYANMNKMMVDPTTTWNVYGANTLNPPNYPGQTYPWFHEAFMGRLMSSNIAGYYDNSSAAPQRLMMPNLGTGLGLDSNGAVDGTIGGFIFQRPYGISTFNKYARAVIPGGQYYNDTSISDPSIFDFYRQLMDGNNKHEWQRWNASNVAVSQTFFDSRLGFELVYNYERYKDGQLSFLQGDQYQISVDVNTKLLDGTANPNVGRPYVGNSGQYGNNWNAIDRDDLRFTAYGELRATDFLAKESLLARILGRHILTGLGSRSIKRTDNRQFSRWASELAYTANVNPAGSANNNITNGGRQYDWIAYIGPSLANASSAANAHLGNVAVTVDPSGLQAVKYYDSHWNAPAGVKPGDPFTYTIPDGPGGASATHTGTQADNPANYVGWTTKSFKILNAEQGDINQLWSNATKNRNVIESKGLVWQGYLWNGDIVPMFAWRRDEVRNAATQAPKDATDVAQLNYGVDTSDANTRRAAGETKSYGAVVHLPKQFRSKLPYNTDISLTFNRSENFKADAPRGDIFGNQIPNPTGKTKDYGILISTLNDRLTFKVNWYKTTVSNATLAADSAGFSGSLYYVWALPYWGATHALAAEDGVQGLRQADWGWPWNGIATLPDGSPDKARIHAIVGDFFKNFPLDQHFADEYGLGMNVAKMHSTNPADWYAGVPTYGVNGQGASALGLQPAYSGRLRDFGSGPAASVDTMSKGIEFEMTAEPIKGLRLTANASKTKATYSAISPAIDTWIQTYTKFLAGDAGLIRLWGGDTFRTAWANNILAPYSVLKGQIGASAPEIPQWRFNGIATYAFSSGPLAGAWIGGAYRWEDRRILGYHFPVDSTGKTTYGTLDINNPWYGPTEDHWDLWAGYGHKLSKRIGWKIQLNLRNVGENPHLAPVSMQPDGSVALSRIKEGMTWELTNTFSF